MAPEIYNKLPKIIIESVNVPVQKHLHNFLVRKADYSVKDFLEDKLWLKPELIILFIRKEFKKKKDSHSDKSHLHYYIFEFF